MTVPPPSLLASGWLPFIVNFYWRAVRLFWQFPGLALTSWWRSPQGNRDAGGDEESQHLFGLAWDIDLPRTLIGPVMQAARAAGLVPVDERTHVHVQLFPKGALARAGVRFPS